METFIIAAIIGVIIGIFSGLLGIGGGTLMVPIFRLGFGMSAISSTATSLFTIIPTSLAGLITHVKNKTCIPKVGVLCGLGGACTSPLGVYLASISPSWAIMFAAAAIIGYSSYSMFRKAIRMPKIAPQGESAVTGKDLEKEAEKAIVTAAKYGYRLIDTASSYKNEDSIGRGIRASGIPRENFFITTKVWNTAQRVGDIEGAFNRSLDRLRLDYVDLYLIHWPVPGCYPETWRALEKIRESGRAKSIGVSNFEEPHLTALFEFSGIIPAVNQIECHPLWNRKPLIAFCRSHGIAVQAYAPLARGLYLNREIMQQLAEKYVRTEAQIGLRYLVQQGISVIPKSTQPDRIFANADVFDFELSEADMALIDTMDEQLRSASIPDDLL